MSVVLSPALRDLDSWKPEGCSIAKAIEIVGTRSAMLILREATYGVTRFDQFVDRIGVTEAVAAKQLRKLTDLGLFEKQPYREAGQRTRSEYVLTEMGRDLLPAVFALMQWGDKWLQPDGAPLRLSEEGTGAAVHVGIHTTDGKDLPMEQIRVGVNRGRRSGTAEVTDQTSRHSGSFPGETQPGR